MAHSPHKRWRGCCLMCSSLRGKLRGTSLRDRQAHRDHRKIGKTRRLRRHDLGDQERT
jgi:hypothetical protein